jgi:hypothetical protein
MIARVVLTAGLSRRYTGTDETSASSGLQDLHIPKLEGGRMTHSQQVSRWPKRA